MPWVEDPAGNSHWVDPSAMPATNPTAPGISQQAAFDQWMSNPNQWGGSLSPDLVNGISNYGWMTAPNADLSGSAPAQFVRDPSTGNIMWHPPGQGPGENYYLYDPSGKFLKTQVGSKTMSPAQGVLAVAGSALGMNALFGGLGAIGTTGTATGGLAGGGGAGVGEGIGAANAVSDAAAYNSLPASAWDTAVAPSTATMGASGGATSFGLSPQIFTNPALSEGVGLSSGTGSSLFSNPAMWSGAVPEGVGYSFAPGLSFAPALEGVPPPANPNSPGNTPNTPPSSNPIKNIMNGDSSMSDWMKLATLGAGAFAGSKPVTQTANKTTQMDPRMDSLFYGQLAPTTQGLLASTTPQGQVAGSQLMSRGSSLLNTNLTPDVFNSPFYQGAANDLQMRTKQLLDQNNLDIQGNSVATGGLGGSRQGVAQGIAAGRAADYLQGNLGQLALGQYNQDATRNLQAVTLGSGLLDQGLQAPFSAAKSAASVYQPFTGFGSTNATTSQGGGTMGAVGGAIGAYGAGKQLGWW